MHYHHSGVPDLCCSLCPHLKEAIPLSATWCLVSLSVCPSTATSFLTWLAWTVGTTQITSLTQNRSASSPGWNGVLDTTGVVYEQPERYTHTSQSYQRPKAAFSMYCDWKSSLERWQVATQVQSPKCHFHSTEMWAPWTAPYEPYLSWNLVSLSRRCCCTPSPDCPQTLCNYIIQKGGPCGTHAQAGRKLESQILSLPFVATQSNYYR